MTATLLHPPHTPTAPACAIDVTKVYGSGETAVTALDGVTVEFPEGVLTAIMGPSGSGKSTLLHVMAGLDSPTSGHAYIGDTDIAGLDHNHITALRRDRPGGVFQRLHPLPA